MRSTSRPLRVLLSVPTSPRNEPRGPLRRKSACIMLTEKRMGKRDLKNVDCKLCPSTQLLSVLCPVIKYFLVFRGPTEAVCTLRCAQGAPDPDCSRCVCGTTVLFIYITSRDQGELGRISISLEDISLCLR